MSIGLVKLYTPRPRFKFNTIGLFTSNNKATVDFYTNTFGFTTDWDGIQPNVEMMLGDMRIILYPRSDFEQMVSYKFQYPMGLNGTVELAFDVPSYADVDKEYQHALRHGAISVLPPTTEPWGQRTCYVADPDGNLIEIGSFTIEQNNH
jgi:catechol 2,3-dioxygenase-like lactoylglutathione lyase family enzyme